MGRFVKPKLVTMMGGQLVPHLDDPAPDPEVFVLVNNGREVKAIPTPVAPASGGIDAPPSR